jgi:predicted AAA+ superfamily ATPase
MRQVGRNAVLRRQRAQRRGRVVEWLCLWHLRLRGWHILARGWRCPAGEIDIVARRGKVLAIIEVKSRVSSPPRRRRSRRASVGGSPAPPRPFCSSDPILPVLTSDST